ncbi:MAG: TetR/AcrR family transcriptional regulator C-terminal domain-containing protein [Myxococcales bacterium]|nr:TetR/AcrR family transcriptional regulator C-terminal domain-containing protein [Myxococcales bacterium]
MPRPPLTREAILDAAVALLDQDGLPGLSMRRLGAALGVEAMSLYHHVPSKAALLDGIHERILLALPPPPRARTWQAFARHQAHALHAALRAHPHAVPLFATRPAATPAATARLERYLAVLVEAGFAPVDALSVIQLLAQLVVGHAMWTSEVGVVDVVGPPRARAPTRSSARSRAGIPIASWRSASTR